MNICSCFVQCTSPYDHYVPSSRVHKVCLKQNVSSASWTWTTPDMCPSPCACGEFKREGSSKAKGQGGQGEVCWISRCQVSADIARILPHRPGASKVHSETDRGFEVQNLGDVDLWEPAVEVWMLVWTLGAVHEIPTPTVSIGFFAEVFQRWCGHHCSVCFSVAIRLTWGQMTLPNLPRPCSGRLLSLMKKLARLNIRSSKHVMEQLKRMSSSIAQARSVDWDLVVTSKTGDHVWLFIIANVMAIEW